MNKTSCTRVYFFDFMRIIAAFAVIMIHISADFIKGFDVATAEFVCGNVFSCVSRFAVPVFLMISGALMLDEKKYLPPKKMLGYAANITVLTFTWAFLYAVMYYVVKPFAFHETFSFQAVVRAMFFGHYHMWYLFLTIGMYLITPLLRCFINIANAPLIRKYLILSGTVCFVVPFLNEIVNLFAVEQNTLTAFVGKFHLDFACEYLIYYVLGWYIANVEIKKNTRIFLYFCGFAGLMCTYIGTKSFPVEGSYYLSNSSLNVFLYSSALYVYIYYLFNQKQYTLNAFWIKISNFTFGAYLIHCIYLFALKLLCRGIQPAIVQILVTFVCSTLLSFVTVFVMSKIPYIKKLVRA